MASEAWLEFKRELEKMDDETYVWFREGEGDSAPLLDGNFKLDDLKILVAAWEKYIAEVTDA